jgi:hypothetical protein
VTLLGSVLRPAALATLLALGGCGESPSPGAGTGGALGTGGLSGSSAGSGTAGAPLAGGAGLAGLGGAAARCNDISIMAPELHMLYDGNPHPPGLGGELVDGTYIASSITWYERAQGQALTYGGIQVELEGSRWRQGDDWPAGDDPNADTFVNYDVTVEGNLLKFAAQCPTGAEGKEAEFTVEGSSLTIYQLEGYVVFGYRFERQ